MTTPEMRQDTWSRTKYLDIKGSPLHELAFTAAVNLREWGLGVNTGLNPAQFYQKGGWFLTVQVLCFYVYVDYTVYDPTPDPDSVSSFI